MTGVTLLPRLAVGRQVLALEAEVRFLGEQLDFHGFDLYNGAMEINELTPAQVDAEIARIQTEIAKQRYNIQRWEKVAHIADGDDQMAKLKYGLSYLESARENARIADERIEVLKADLAPYTARYADERWPRYFRVTNATGHVHGTLACSTCFPTTEFAWLTELSGKTAAEMIEVCGHMACTVCFPDAPTDMNFKRSLYEAEAAAKEKEDALCPGSGMQADNQDFRYYQPRGNCPVCKKAITPTSTGKVRKHKKES